MSKVCQLMLVDFCSMWKRAHWPLRLGCESIIGWGSVFQSQQRGSDTFKPFYANLKSRQLLPFYTEVQVATF